MGHKSRFIMTTCAVISVNIVQKLELSSKVIDQNLIVHGIGSSLEESL